MNMATAMTDRKKLQRFEQRSFARERNEDCHAFLTGHSVKNTCGPTKSAQQARAPIWSIIKNYQGHKKKV